MLTSHAVPNDTLNLAFTLSRGVPPAGAFEPHAHSASPLHEAQRGAPGLKVVRGQAGALISAPGRSNPRDAEQAIGLADSGIVR